MEDCHRHGAAPISSSFRLPPPLSLSLRACLAQSSLFSFSQVFLVRMETSCVKVVGGDEIKERETKMAIDYVRLPPHLNNMYTTTTTYPSLERKALLQFGLPKAHVLSL